MSDNRRIIDVSSWQGPLKTDPDFDRDEPGARIFKHNPPLDAVAYGGLRDAGVIGVIVKSSEGLGYMDPTFVEHWRQADAAGLIVGSYHFSRQENRPSVAGAIAEADWYIACQRKCHSDREAWKPGNIVPVLDFETGSPDYLYSRWRDAFLGRVKAQTGHDGMLYTFTKFNNWVPPKHGQDRLWLANYSKNPELPPGYSRWDLWQYTSTARFPGVAGEVDASVLPDRSGALERIRCHHKDK